MDFRSFLATHLVRLDGGMGTLLQERGLAPGELPERWNLSHPDTVKEIHRAYFDAGSHVVATNTFGANPFKYGTEELAALVRAAVANARAAQAESTAAGEKFVALDVGPLGRLLAPFGDLSFEAAVAAFAETVRLGVQCGVDLILIETMTDAYETRAALLAARESSDLPIIVTNAYSESGRLLTGATPEAMVAMLEGLGADAIGANCSAGPAGLAGVVRALLAAASVPVVLKPNAGLPRLVNGETVFSLTPEEFANEVAPLVREGVRAFGGCCGTTPAHIAALREATEGLLPTPITKKTHTVVSSYAEAVRFGDAPLIIGERINPTGKRRFREALLSGDIGYLVREAVAEEEAGAHLLDVNVGLPELDEPSVLRDVVLRLQAVTPLPLVIDTASPAAMEAALRVYCGKALVNSVNGKAESLHTVLPLVRKYGGAVIALTLDEGGIPPDAEGRLAIARRILATAADYGIPPHDVIFDPLTMTVATDPQAAAVTLDALAKIKGELDCHTSLGISNVSFGLPARDTLNAAFLTLALGRGLSAAILNPHSGEVMRALLAFSALSGVDARGLTYTGRVDAYRAEAPAEPAKTAAPTAPAEDRDKSPLYLAIRRGLAEAAATAADALLATVPPLELVQTEVVPALDAVGKEYEAGRLYLPSLLLSAEAAGAAAERVKARLSRDGERAEGRGVFVLATVKGDIHDIGKNIAKLILENYGFAVVDLGRDVPPEEILAAVLSHNAPFCGLSALMTTTVPAMEKTISLLRERAPFCRTVVGGAVLTAEVAAAIGADCYAPDPMEAVRFATGR